MPLLLPSAVHFDATLTNVSLAYRQNAANFVASRVFPQVPVAKQSDRYWIFDRAAMNTRKMKKRAPSTESAGANLTVSSDTYFADVWALHFDIDDQTRANADPGINLEALTSEQLTFQGLLEREAQFAEEFMVDGVWAFHATGSDATPTSGEVLRWNDAASTPIQDVREALTTVQGRTGFRPNKLILGQQVKDALSDNADIVDRIKFTSGNNNPAIVNDTALAALFEVQQVLTMGAIENTAADGAAESNTFIGGKNALLVYAPDTANIMQPSAGMIFNWTGYLGNSPGGVRIGTFRMEPIKSDRVEAEMTYDMKLTGADLGYLFESIVD